MIQVLAKQLVYTRLEPAYSPQRFNGFQILFCSPELENVKLEIVESVESFAYDGHPSSRKNRHLQRAQFFELSDGNVVLARSTPASHSKYIDKSDRGGGFITHCFVISETDFCKIGFNPFAILDEVEFIADPEAMYEQFILNGDDVPAVVPLDLNRNQATKQEGHEGIRSSNWRTSEVNKLYALALGAEQLRSRNEKVLFYGSSDAIYETLYIVFCLLADKNPLRRFCTFCTEANRYRGREGAFWAVGRSQEDVAFAHQVDVDQCTVVTSVERSDDSTLYFSWLNFALENYLLDTVLEQADTARIICEALERRQQVTDTTFSQSALLGIYHLVPENVNDQLLATSRQLFSGSFSELICQYLVKNHEPVNLIRLGLVDGELQLEADQILSDYFQDCLEGGNSSVWSSLKNSDWSEIRSIAVNAKNWRLLFWAAALECPKWTRNRQKKTLVHALSMMSHDEFLLTLKASPDPLDPVFLLSEEHWSELFQWRARSPDLGRKDFRWFSALFQSNYGLFELDDVSPFLNVFAQSQIRSLWKVIAERTDLPDRRKQQVIEHLDEKKGIREWISNTLERIAESIRKKRPVI